MRKYPSRTSFSALSEGSSSVTTMPDHQIVKEAKMKAVIFDLDGTLLDTIGDIADSMNAVLARQGLPPHSVEKYKLYVGDGAANLVKRSVAGIEYAEETLMRLEAEYKAEYLKRQADKTMPYAGIPELLAALAERGVKIAVLSNKPHVATLEVMAHFFPDISFSALIGHRPGYPVKPDPAGALEILEMLGLPPEDVLYVGDTGTDMQTAKAAGLKAVGALWGFRGKKELEDNGADMIAEHPLDIISNL